MHIREFLMKRLLLIALTLLTQSGTTTLHAQHKDRNTMVRDDRARIVDDGFWIYNDIDKGLSQAQATGKPLLVIFRCIPCEACAQLDEQVVENNPAVRKALSRFVCVRQVYTNGVDLSRFQFDYDQSWAAFFMNGDGTILGRYGTRSHQTESSDDVTLEGFLATMNQVLNLHADYAAVKDALAAKMGKKLAVSVPEEFPSLKERYANGLNYEGEVAKSCIHCHQIGDAWHELYRSAGKPIPTEALYPYPHPKILGLIMDPRSAVRVAEVVPESWAAEAGFQAGDQIREMAGQPLVSMADIQWVLHAAADTVQLPVVVERGDSSQQLTLDLPAGWREAGDISWRVTSWPMRGMVLGGMRLRSATAQELQAANRPNAVGLVIQSVGQFGKHAAAKRAGFKPDDVLLSFDGTARPMTESQLLVHLMRSTKPSDMVDVEVLRAGKVRTIQLPIQE